jgi:hypothetical protein
MRKLLILFLVDMCNCTNQMYVVPYTFTMDQNTGLKHAFQVNNIMANISTSFVACLSQCNRNPICMTIIYENPSMTCLIFNKTFCFNRDALSKIGIDLYGKRILNGKKFYKSEHKTHDHFCNNFEDACEPCGTCQRYKYKHKEKLDIGKYYRFDQLYLTIQEIETRLFLWYTLLAL